MSAEIYDPRDGAFHATASMSARRFKLPFAVVPLSASEVLVAGGAEGAELFDGRSFKAVPGTFGASWAFAAATALDDGMVLITGGYDEQIRPTAGAWLFRR